MDKDQSNTDQNKPQAATNKPQPFTSRSVTIVTYSADGKDKTISHVRQFPESFITARTRWRQGK